MKHRKYFSHLGTMTLQELADLRSRKRAEVFRLYHEGVSVKGIEATTRVGYRTIYRWLKHVRGNNGATRGAVEGVGQ